MRRRRSDESSFDALARPRASTSTSTIANGVRCRVAITTRVPSSSRASRVRERWAAIVPRRRRTRVRSRARDRSTIDRCRRHAVSPFERSHTLNTMSAFTISISAVNARANVVAMRRQSANARRASVKAKYSVTLDGPDGKTTIQCADDTYILDAAEVRCRRMLCVYVLFRSSAKDAARVLKTSTRDDGARNRDGGDREVNLSRSGDGDGRRDRVSALPKGEH